MRESWLAKYNHKTCYWLAGHSACEEAIDFLKVQAVQGLMASAEPLFLDPPFDSLIAYTPWLVPLTDIVLSLPDAILSMGILIHSNAEKSLVARHLRSLLNAEMNEEKMLFRFYDVKVLAPMLPMMSLTEQSDFMGNIEALLIQLPLNDIENQDSDLGVNVQAKAKNDFIVIENDKAALFQTRSEPWWIIAPEHLEGLYNFKHHAYAISRRLWELLPNMMAGLTNPLASLELGFEKAQDQKLNKDDAELWVLAHIAQLTQTELDTLVSSLVLDIRQQEFVQQWMENSTWQV